VLHIAEVLEEMKIDASSLKLRVGIFGAEPWSENMRRDIEKKLKLKHRYLWAERSNGAGRFVRMYSPGWNAYQ
jgi:phenylacetate-coenzyme A ligase PaaK-like adenylate-forming protein